MLCHGSVLIVASPFTLATPNTSGRLRVVGTPSRPTGRRTRLFSVASSSSSLPQSGSLAPRKSTVIRCPSLVAFIPADSMSWQTDPRPNFYTCVTFSASADRGDVLKLTRPILPPLAGADRLSSMSGRKRRTGRHRRKSKFGHRPCHPGRLVIQYMASKGLME
ncbi:hypothetical protein B0T13DRAFT_178302 [Neurospora crassa]|nr:hypothetical protein B0T13DRAFT_178302 [Neurospora crassa]